MRVLIVEDDNSKLQKITSVILEIEGFSIDDITIVSNSHDAKALLAKCNYDVLILDIAIPPRLDLEVVMDEGAKLLDEIATREKYNVPTHIVGITSFVDVYKESIPDFTRRLSSLIHFNVTSDEWSETLRNGLLQFCRSKNGLVPGAELYGSKLAIICALHDPELSNVLDLDWNWIETSVPGDATRYYKGSIVSSSGSSESVWLACASRKGMTASAILATKMIARFKPEFVAMVGIAAGVRNKTAYGDVVVAEMSWDAGSGKKTGFREGQLEFLPDPHYFSLDFDLINKFLRLKDDSAFLHAVRDKWKADKPGNILTLHIGPMASGAAVLSDGTTLSDIGIHNRSIIAVEMEAYAVFAAANEASEPRPKAFVIKSVVDFADDQKDDRFQKYGAYTSANVLKHFAEHYL